MKTMNWIFASLLLLACGGVVLAKTEGHGRIVPAAQTTIPPAQERADKDTAALDAQREKRALEIFLKLGQTLIASAADAMPADKYGFSSTVDESQGCRGWAWR